VNPKALMCIPFPTYWLDPFGDHVYPAGWYFAVLFGRGCITCVCDMIAFAAFSVYTVMIVLVALHRGRRCVQCSVR